MKINKYAYLTMLLAAGIALLPAAGAVALANGKHLELGNFKIKKWNAEKPAASGTVSGVNAPANTFSLTVKSGAVYTVNIGNASITKFSKDADSKIVQTQITASQINQNDNAIVYGTISGNSINATKISIGVFSGCAKNSFGAKINVRQIGGTVSSISGATIVLKTRSNTEFTVTTSSSTVFTRITRDANDKFVKSSISLSDIKLGSNLRVIGTISGNSIAATKIIDGLAGTGFGHRYR